MTAKPSTFLTSLLKSAGPAPISKVASPTKLSDFLKESATPPQEEWTRIANIPRTFGYDGSLVDWVHLDKSAVELRPLQKAALACIQEEGGLFGPIPVGFGKTLIAWLAPVVARAKRPLIMMPSHMVESFTAEVNRFRHHFRQGVREPEIRSYAILSSRKQSTLLEDLRPDMIIGDEAHTLRNEESSRGIRLRRYLHKYPDTKVVLLSGTFVDKKLSDLAELTHFCLGERNFIPVDTHYHDIWKQCVDLDGRPSETHWKAFQPLVHAEGMEYGASRTDESRRKVARRAVASRMSSTPGVVMSEEVSSAVPLFMHRVDMDVPCPVEDLIETLEVGGQTPDGDDIIIEDSQKARLTKTLSLGFFHRWAWEQVGGRDEEWLMARRSWSRALRLEISENAREHYDSAALIEGEVQRTLRKNPGEPGMLYNAWRGWVPHKEKLQPPTVPVWVDYFVFIAISKWLSAQTRPTIVWYQHQVVGEMLAQMGLEVYGGGTSQPAFEGKHIAASISVHGTGKNLQAWDQMLVIEPPSSGKTWEQLIGRTHRQGQNAPRVDVFVLCHTEVLNKAVDKAIEEAEFTCDLTGCVQRLQRATWEKTTFGA
jgi:hypothetical protein